MAQIASFSFAGTLDGNDPGKVVVVGVDAASLPNTASATNEDYFSVVRARALIEPVIYDAGYWKLRQISIGYDFAKFLKSSFPIKGFKLSAVANNVLMLKKWALLLLIWLLHFLVRWHLAMCVHPYHIF